jgi:spore germination protein (amino acid permease)
MKALHGNIGIVPIFSAVILGIGLMNHVLVLPPLLAAAQRDAWVTVLGACLPFFLWICILHYIMKATGQQPILKWLTAHYGTWTALVFRIFFFVYLALISVMTIRETSMWTHTSYLPRTPYVVLAFALILLCLYTAYQGMRTIAIASGIMLPFVIIFGDFVMSANFSQKEYGLLFPLFEHGPWRVIKAGVYIGGGLAELFPIVLLQHYFKSRVPLWAMWILGAILIVLVMGPLTGAITEFGPIEAARLRYPAYEEWRLVRLGRYITHADFLSIYQWLSGAVIRLALALYLAMEIVAIRNRTARNILISALGLAYLIVANVPISDMQYLSILRNYYFPYTLIGVAVMSVILLCLVILARRKEGNARERETRRRAQ